ncbi:MAG: hypothetical protein ACI4JJ_01485 [Huintestinicola sp.]
MSVRFDLTAAAFELIDAVIYMDGSPAYAAFKEEIEAILSDFNSTGHLSSSWKVDEKDLTAKSEDTLKNMHRAFLIWSYKEETEGGKNVDSCVGTYVKLFFKSQEETLISLNGGSKMIAPESIKGFIEKYKQLLLSDSAAFESAKTFFKGYVYGYFFNYLSEQKIMKKYAEMLAYLGVMSNKIPTSISEQQKILPKMALLLSNDRFKYLNGFVPTELMLSIIYDRIEFASLSEGETALIKSRIKEYILANYKTDKEDDIDLLADDVTVTLMSDIFRTYVNVPAFSTDLYNKCYNGVRTFLDSDRDDTGKYGADTLCSLVSDKCASDYDSYYSSAREANLDTDLKGSELGYKYPIICADENDYFFAPLYEELIYPVLDGDVYQILPADGIVSGIFPFADEALATNCIRTVAGITERSVSVRKDKLANLNAYNTYSTDTTISERDRKMLMLEQMLCIVSGNCSEAKYKALITENVFGTKLYEDYIRYRMDVLFNQGIESLSTKKTLLDRINDIKM